MKFIVSSTELLKHLQQIGGIVSTNTVLPILLDFLFKIENSQLTITGTDLETVMKVSVEVEAKEKGEVCIPARILLDSLRNLPEQPLTFTIDSSYGVEITSDNGKYKVMGENPENFPKAPSSENAQSFEMPAGAMLDVINKCLFATSTDDLRPAMTGVFFDISTERFIAVATDAHRLVKLTRNDVKGKEDATFIVPKKPLGLLKNLLTDREETLEIAYNEKHLFIKLGDSEMVCRLIDARFPDYKVVIPKDNPYSLSVNKNDFQNALRRVSVFSNKSSYLVALTINGSELQMEGQDVDFSFEGNERMVCNYDGEDMKIAFNGKFLVELLSAAETEDVVMELSTPTTAGIIKPTEKDPDEELLMLVMPLMLN